MAVLELLRNIYRQNKYATTVYILCLCEFLVDRAQVRIELLYWYELSSVCPYVCLSVVRNGCIVTKGKLGEE